jgi:hypothetical protein
MESPLKDKPLRTPGESLDNQTRDISNDVISRIPQAPSRLLVIFSGTRFN